MVVALPDFREQPANIIRDRVSLQPEMQDRPPMVRTPPRGGCSSAHWTRLTRLRLFRGDLEVPFFGIPIKRVCLDSNGREFVRRIKSYAKRHGLPVRFEPSIGKGSHGALQPGERRTIVKRTEIGKRLMASRLKQLGGSMEEF